MKYLFITLGVLVLGIGTYIGLDYYKQGQALYKPGQCLVQPVTKEVMIVVSTENNRYKLVDAFFKGQLLMVIEKTYRSINNEVREEGYLVKNCTEVFEVEPKVEEETT